MNGSSVAARPEGLLRHESVFYSLLPPHVGMRQYWGDFESLERWARAEPHMQWWNQFLRDSGGTGFWHETYFMRGGVEAIHDDIKVPLGLSSFAPTKPAGGPMFSARARQGVNGVESMPAPVTEVSFYGEPES